MQRIQARHGFTTIELMITVALMGVILAIAMPQLKGYVRREDTRRAATEMSDVLTRAMSEAKNSGHMTWVLFAEPTNGLFPFEENQVAAVVTDTNFDNTMEETDSSRPIFMPNSGNPDIALYGVNGTPLAGISIPDQDESTFLADSDLGSLTNGTTLPVDAIMGVPVIGFSNQNGSPVRADSPTSFGSGAGGVYLTDNDGLVFAILVLPMGEIRTMVLDSTTEKWR
jgi:prepilin-type N-terminal cleavage/methylation domain-containing protein